MSERNRSICEPARRCHCGAKVFSSGGHCECTACGLMTDFYESDSEACAAWDRGDVMSLDELKARHGFDEEE